MLELWNKLTQHTLTWTASGIQTWITGAFPLSLLYPTWAVDMKSEWLDPGLTWLQGTQLWHDAAGWAAATVDVLGGVLSTTA